MENKKTESESKNERTNESKNERTNESKNESKNTSKSESKNESNHENKSESKSESKSENVNSTINNVNPIQPPSNPTPPTLNPTSNVQVILDKIKNLPISNDDKTILMKQFKQNIINPSLNEDQNLSDIQKKYLNPKQIMDTNYIHSQPDYSTFKDPNLSLYPQQNLQLQAPFQQPMHYYNGNQQLQLQNMNQSDLMTKSQFEILKNKIDSLQYELIDLLRHVKDYTQRYMNSVRQQDLVKIDEYVAGLFEVDKSIKEVKEKSLELEAKTPEEGADTQESVIAKTTNGIKNAMGSLGSSISGITSLVSSTANLANSYLSTPIIKKKEGEQPKTSKPTETNKPNQPTETTETKNTNVVSVDEYIKDKENREGTNNLPINSIKKTEAEATEAEVVDAPEEATEPEAEATEPEAEATEPEAEATEPEEEVVDAPEEEVEVVDAPEEATEPEEEVVDAPEEVVDAPEEEVVDAPEEEEATEPEEEGTTKNLGNALQELNAKINTKTQPQSKKIKKDKITSNIQSGGTYNTLKNNISVLKLKITKKKLQKKLKKELQKQSKNTKHNFKKYKIKKITKNKKNINN